MSYNINYDDIRTMYNISSSKLGEWSDELEGIRNAFNISIIDSKCAGKGFDAMRAYLSEVHLSIITSLQAVVAEYTGRFLLYMNGFYNYEDDIHAKINQGVMEDIVEKLNTVYNDISTYHELSDTETKRVSDIIFVTLSELSEYTTAVEDRVDRLTYYKDAIGTYDYNYGANNLDNLSEMVLTLRTVIYRLYGQKEINVESAEGIISFRELEELDKGIKLVSQFLTEYESDIGKATENQKQVWAQIEDELAEERKEQGWTKVITSGLELGMYAVVLCKEIKTGKGAFKAVKLLTTGKNVKAAIASGAVIFSDSSMIAVSGANFIEGVQDVYYGYKGDPYTESKNFIADPLFGDDRESYERFTLGLQIVNAVVHPLSEFSLVAGGGKASYQAEKMILTSTAIEGGTSLATEGITYALSLNEYESLGLSITTGVFMGGLYYYRPISVYDGVPDVNVTPDMHLNYVGEGGTNPSTYDGVKGASEFLKQQGVPRQYRKQILESFDVRTIKLQIADDSTYGLRFYGGNANAEGRYLFETFSPLTNRNNLALPYEWNSMTGIQQFKVKNGTTMITGTAAPQSSFGSQYTGGANQWYINNLEDIIKCQ